METRDYFLIALGFLVSTTVMALIGISLLPPQFLIGYTNSPNSGPIYAYLWTFLFLPFSLFLGFLTAGVINELQKIWSSTESPTEQ